MFFYIVLHQYLPLSVYEVPLIRVNTTKSTYTIPVCAPCVGLQCVRDRSLFKCQGAAIKQGGGGHRNIACG